MDASRPDGTVPGDDGGGGQPEASTDAGAGDASTDADGGGQDASTTLDWPPGHSFPTFPPVQALDVADITGLTTDEQYLFATLEGVVNRTEPRIYLRNAGEDQEDVDGGAFWLGMINVPKTTVADPHTLLTKYRSEIAGVIIWDPSVIDTVNLATTMAGFEGGVVASPSLAATLLGAPYNLPVLADLRTMAFKSAGDVYTYELSAYQSKATTRLIIGLDPTRTDPLRDYAIATQALVVWLDPTKASTDRVLLDKFLAGLTPNAPYMGWWTNEAVGVGAAPEHGVPTFAADWSRNLTVYSGVPTTIQPPARPTAPTLATKAYVAIFMSDGDNLQENQHLIPLKWADPARGKVPISWTVQPALVDVAPLMLQYYYATATANDVLVSGPSGLGYTYPQNWPVSLFAQYTAHSADYLARAGLDVITVWNNGALLSADPTQASDYATSIPHLLGVTDQLGGGGLSLIDSALPLLVFATGYGETEQALEGAINNQLGSWTKSAPLFLAVQGDMNQSVINPTSFLAVQNYFASNSDVVFVRGDHLFQLIRQSKGLPTDP
ncbi:MAG TPA: GxGYxYP domain-containing protein [Polyangiaceae bacterium]